MLYIRCNLVFVILVLVLTLAVEVAPHVHGLFTTLVRVLVNL